MATLKVTIQNVPSEITNCDELIFAKITNGQLQNRNDVIDYSIFSVEERSKIEEAFSIIQNKVNEM